jgi:GT2 family glycosyltransferase
VPVDSAAPLAAPSRSSSGVSVIINYRDGVEETLRCLDALRLQQFDGAIEIVLVNNASLPDSVRTIVSHAVALFGQDAVVPLDYSAAFNHSAQSNLGATAARQDLLVMLSNDALFITPDALAKARDIAELPWVATCGFRVIGRRNGKTQLQSMGLGLNPRGNLMQGGSPLVSHHPPPFALDRTIEVAGNTFAAVMVRRDLYLGLGGLDAAAFPIAYNDVDFCLRATASGRRHVVVGSAIVDHLAHGSREMDLDLPIDARIIDRLPPVAVLTRVGFQSL